MQQGCRYTHHQPSTAMRGLRPEGRLPRRFRCRCRCLTAESAAACSWTTAAIPQPSVVSHRHSSGNDRGPARLAWLNRHRPGHTGAAEEGQAGSWASGSVAGWWTDTARSFPSGDHGHTHETPDRSLPGFALPRSSQRSEAAGTLRTVTADLSCRRLAISACAWGLLRDAPHSGRQYGWF